ncbi:hypothetical protein Y1Q_0004694 [Alligator mississippiensis]|uniref:Uncharacterized protein n=1 Tax=Alligator mississippiensis TaxID=8496 RepID=A0A151P6D7_ALLMI|nr:hypothetical protein Y1Q_0004694 [Alligator mississippiensis]
MKDPESSRKDTSQLDSKTCAAPTCMWCSMRQHEPTIHFQNFQENFQIPELPGELPQRTLESKRSGDKHLKITRIFFGTHHYRLRNIGLQGTWQGAEGLSPPLADQY